MLITTKSINGYIFYNVIEPAQYLAMKKGERINLSLYWISIYQYISINLGLHIDKNNICTLCYNERKRIYDFVKLTNWEGLERTVSTLNGLVFETLSKSKGL